MAVNRVSVKIARVACGLVLSLAAFGFAGCSSTPNDTYDLAAALTPITTKPAVVKKQILVADPTALKVLDSDQIVVRVSGTELQYLAKSQWSDKLPRMVQAKLVEAFEKTGKLGGVGKPGQGLAIDYQLLTDIRRFEVDASSPRQAHVEIAVKLLNDRNGTVVAQQAFSATVNASGTENQALVNALSAAFAKVTGDVVGWALTKV